MKPRDVIVWGGIGEKLSNKGTQWYLQNRIFLGTYNGHQSGNIYNSDGLSPALCSTDYKAPLKILTGRKKMNKQLKENFTEVGEGKYVTTERERESCYAVTTRPHSMPLTKKQDNYVLEMEKKKIKLRESTKKGYAEAGEGDGIEISRSGCTTRGGVVHKDATGTLNCDGASWGTLGEDFRIRRLTPKECERLQAFPDGWTEFGVNGEKISDTQRYKCLGNAVTTTVISYLIDEMFKGVFDDEDEESD